MTRRNVFSAAETMQELWEQAQTEVAGRLARIARGETTAPPQVVRCLRAFVAPERAR